MKILLTAFLSITAISCSSVNAKTENRKPSSVELSELPAQNHTVGTCLAIITGTAQRRLDKPQNKNLIIRSLDVREIEPGDYQRKVHYRAYFQYETKESKNRTILVSGYDAYSGSCSLLGTIINDRQPLVNE